MNRRSFLRASAALPGLAGAGPAAAAPNGQLKITALETDVLRFPPGAVFSDAIHDFGTSGGGVALRILTGAGITGWAYSSFGMIPGGPRVVQTILQEEIAPALIGKDPFFIKRLRADMWRATEYHGVQGVAQFAIAAADIALWDILGKAAGMPVYKLLGACRDRVPAYNMCGWYFENDGGLSHYRRVIHSALEEGFQAVKIKVGRGSLEEDVKRIRAAREIMGKDRRIMVDANQALNRNEALRRGRAYQEEGCFWYEEPLAPHEKDGYAELARELDIRIATGENEYTKYAFLDLLKRGGADVVQPDNRRAGGVTEWMEIGAIADAFGVELASHGGGPTNMHMLLAMPNAIYIETGSLREDSSHVEQLRMVNGEIVAPETPGMGSELRRDWIEKYKVA
ncbi:MAG TPA: mandelate racemase/muconate lactonizing enzyme family protein [Bryobacteraceae bacterium]